MKTASDFNNEYYFKLYVDEVEASAQPSSGQNVRTALFYSVLVAMVVFAFFYSTNKQPGKRFGPFAYNTVLTYSMHSVYPQGSLITSWALGMDEPVQAGLDHGTDLVFIKEDGTVVVHRVIEIFQNFEDSGQRAFLTQGVDNPYPDSWTTYEGNVIGRVTWHLPYAGNILRIIADNIMWVAGGVILLSAIIALLKMIFRKEETLV